MALPGCARQLADTAPPKTVGIAVIDTPPAEILRCPARPEGFPTDADSWAIVPAQIRAAARRVAEAFAANTGQLERLIEWQRGEPCPAAVN